MRLENILKKFKEDKEHTSEQIMGMILVIVGIAILWPMPWYQIIGIWVLGASTSVTSSSNLKKALVIKIERSEYQVRSTIFK